MRISDWSSDVCSSDLVTQALDEWRDANPDAVGGQMPEAVRDALEHVYGAEYIDDIKSRDADNIVELADNLRVGVPFATPVLDRKNVEWGKSVSVRVDIGGRRNM